MNLGTHVYNLIDSYRAMDIQLADGKDSDGYLFNQHETIKRINLYINDKYLDRNDEAIFWNLSNSRITHFGKNIDLDTKDLQPYGIGEVNFYQTWILKMKFYRWLQDNKFALTLNDLSEGLATYGSIIWKKTKKDGKVKLEEADLRNMYFNPTVKSIRDTDVIELHDLSQADLEKKEDIWDNVADVISTEKTYSKGKPFTCSVWELWGHVKDGKKSIYKHVIGYGQGDSEVILFEEDKKPEDNPYYDFHLGRYRGRWMRVGVVERLFKLQERANTLVNQNAQTTEIASLLLLSTANSGVNGNVLTQAENGQIIPDETLKQIVLQNPGIASFIQELQLIERQADKLCLTPEIITGDNMPSGTPFRSVATIANSAKSAFRYIKESVGETVSYLMLEQIFPAVVKDWNKGEIFELAGDEQDITLYDEALKRTVKWERYKEKLLAGQAMSQEEMLAIEAQIEQEIGTIGRRVETPKGFFNFKFGIRLNVTGEQVDKQQKNDASFNALQMTAQNPAMANIPLFKQYCEDNGISYWKLTPQQVEEIKQGAVSGAKPMDAPKTDALLASVNE